MNLLFLNVGRRCELVEEFARALIRVSPGLIWGSDPNPLAPALQMVDRIAPLPREVDSPEFVASLARFLVREKIDVVIPTIDPDLERLDRWREQLQREAPKARLLLSPTQTIRTARDKRKSRAAFAALGAEVPTGVDPGSAEIEFPVFVKPAAGSASQDARRIASREDLDTALATVIDPMFEMIVEGPETTVDVLLDFSGVALRAVPRRRLQVRGGEVTRGVVESNAALEALAMRLAQGLGCTGPVTLQFRNPSPDRWVAMELNARLGGGLPLSIAAGADWPRWILELCCGGQPDVSGPIVDGLVLSRCDRSVFVPPKGSMPPGWQGEAHLPHLLIFDLDDTLYSERQFVSSGHRAVAQAVWRDYGIDIEAELQRRFALGQRGDVFTAALKARDVEVPSDYVIRVLVPAYREHVPIIQPYVGTRQVLERLRAAGHSTALLSDGWAAVQRRKLAALGLEELFDEVVLTDELGRASWKPATRGFELILERRAVSPANAAYVADNPAKDFIAPNHLGMGSFRVVRAGTEHATVIAKPRSNDAMWHIHELGDLLKRRVA